MPGQKLLTQLDSQTCLKVAWRTAQDLGFTLTPIEDDSKRFTATKGSLIASVLAGPFAPQCVFQVTAERYPDSVEVSLERNEPRLIAGKIGADKVKRQADELFAAIVAAVEKAGGSIKERKEY
jgi:hypothetical protein